MTTIPAENDPLDPELQRIDDVCDLFEAQWLAGGERPQIAPLLEQADSAERERLFGYLLEVELDYRQRHEEELESKYYYEQYPQFAKLVSQKLRVTGTRSLLGHLTIDRDASAVLVSRPLTVGAMLGGYELLEVLGKGGMGVVFKARQVALDRIVALKTIKYAETGDSPTVQRFRAEAEAAGRLSHDGIVPVYDVGEQNGIHFFSMALIEGTCLSEEVADGPLEPRRAAAIARDMAVAVQFAHERGLVHRDLKPGNVMLERGVRVKVTDFGLAKLVRGDSNLTMTGQILGTPSYMPPEQAAGDSELIDARSDVYSIGATLYHLLTGVPPFRAANPIETLRQVLEKEPVAPRQLDSSLDVDLETICLKCLQKEPGKRYASAAEAAADLDRWLAGQPIKARPVGPVGRLRRWCKRQPVVASLLALVVLSLIVGTAVSANYALVADRRAGEAHDNFLEANKQTTRAETARAEAVTAGEAAETARAAEERQRNETEEMLYWTTIQLAAERLATGRDGEVAMMLWDTPRERRGWEWGWLMAQCQHPRWVLPAHQGAVLAMSLTADGSKLATCGNDATLALWDLQSRELIWRTEVGKRYDHTVIHPLGKFVAASRGGAIRIHDIASGEATHTIKIDNLHLLAFNTDGSLLYSCEHGIKDSRNKPVTAWNTSDWSVHATAQNPGVAGAIAFDPAGKYLALGSGNYPSKTVLYEAQTLQPIDTIEMYWTMEALVLDSSRNFMAASLRNGLHSLSLTEGKLESLKTEGVSETIVVAAAYQREMDRVAAGALDGTITVHRTDATPMGRLRHGDSLTCLAAKGDSQLLSAGRGGFVKCWDLATVLDQRRFGGLSNRHMNGASDIALASDGTLLAYCGYSESYEKFHVADLASTRQVMYEQPISQKQMRFGMFIPGTYQFCFVVPGKIEFYDAAVEPWRHVRTIPCRNERQHSLDIDALGKYVLLAYRDRGADVFRLADGAQMPQAELSGAGLAQLRDDGKQAIMRVAGEDRADVWEVETGKLLWQIPVDNNCTAAALHPTEPIAALGTEQGHIIIWDISENRELRRLVGHDIWVTNMRFSPDGNRLFSTSQDQTAKVWNWRLGRNYVTLPHGNGVFGLSLGKQGRMLATTATGPHAHVREVPGWDVEPYSQAFLDEAHNLRVRDLARLLLIELSGNDPAYEALIEGIKARPAVPEEVRQLALQLAEAWHPPQ